MQDDGGGEVTDEVTGDDAARTGWSRAAKVQIGILVANIALWLGIFGWTISGDRSDPPDRLDDTAFAAAAEPICAATVTRIEALGLPTEVADALGRARFVDDENDLLRQMVGDLEAIPRPGGEQGEWVTTWLTDWRTHIGDRQAWADDLRVGDDHLFVETPRGNEQVSNVIDNFAEVNDMESCITPGDV